MRSIGKRGGRRAGHRVRPVRAALGVLVLVLVAGAVGCAPGPQGDDAAAGADAVRHELRGEVIEVSRAAGTLTIEHEEIEGFMAAMTMPFNVRDDWVFGAAEPGAGITATLVVEGTSSWLEDVVIRKGADRGAAADVVVRQPQPGDEVPSIALVDQDERSFTIQERYTGEWWVFTFVYTRCPLPDFCPRMSESLAEVYRAIEADPQRYGDAEILSVTVDPAYDTPAVLRAYGLRYLPDASGFARWSFARAEPAPLGQFAHFTGLRFMPDAGEIVHSLRTVIVDPEGHVVATHVGNRWQPSELLADLAAAVAEHGGEQER